MPDHSRTKLRKDTLNRLNSRLGDGAGADFARTVILQVAHPAGGREPDPRRETEVLDRVLNLLDGTGPPPDLLGDTALLAACFQNIDLLYNEPPYPNADAVSTAVLDAVGRLSEP